MEGDDKIGALHQLLNERCSGSEFRDDDLKNLVDAGYETEADLKAATMESLTSTLPGRYGKVDVVLKTFGATAGVKSGDLLSAGHGLSQFVACLRDQGLQEIINSAKAGSLIKLPKEVVWMGDESTFTNELYVRPCYQELLDAKERYFELNKKLNSVVFTGTLGIGKSHFCALVIAKKLIEGMIVYFESSRLDTKEFFKLELEGGVRTLESLRVLDLLRDTATAIYIVDGGPPSRPNSPLETQVFASPSHSLYRAKKKAWPWLYLHTPLLT